MPDGSLTPAQYEILEIVWDAGRQGATIAEIWQAISESKDVARTTILNLVDRLEKRGWLIRREGAGANRFAAGVTRKKASALLAHDFVDAFFGGSTSDLVMSLLGSRRVNADELQRLRELIDAKAPDRTGSQGKEP